MKSLNAHRVRSVQSGGLPVPVPAVECRAGSGSALALGTSIKQWHGTAQRQPLAHCVETLQCQLHSFLGGLVMAHQAPPPDLSSRVLQY